MPEDRSKWFKEEVHLHDGQLKSWLKGTFPSVRDVDDVVQESYLRIWKAKATEPINSAKAPAGERGSGDGCETRPAHRRTHTLDVPLQHEAMAWVTPHTAPSTLTWTCILRGPLCTIESEEVFL